MHACMSHVMTSIVSLLLQVLEAYENEHFFQMVMEKHGDGLDLFEFIERGPKLTEKHISHMFRQVHNVMQCEVQRWLSPKKSTCVQGTHSNRGF